MATGIQWTDETWNPTVGCSRVSEGCRHCYAETAALGVLQKQHGEGAYKGIVEKKGSEGRWTGTARFLPSRLDAPLRWRKPRMVFVDSMSDLFHPDITNEQIAAVFGVMAATPRHTYQLLTKRPRRMLEWFGWIEAQGDESDTPNMWCAMGARLATDRAILPHDTETRWPLSNVWIGVSAEDQATFDERVPLLLECPAAVRWVSAEPLLGPIDLHDGETVQHLNWVVVGGESGKHARPCNREWIESIVAQCREASVPVFVKQLGAHYVDSENGVGGVAARPDPGIAPPIARLRDRKGGAPSEWPESLRVREWPVAAHLGGDRRDLVGADTRGVGRDPDRQRCDEPR